MHPPFTFHSYLKPVTLPQIPKMYSEVQNLGLFSIEVDVTVFFVFFYEVDPNWDPRTQARWHIAP